MSEDQTHVEFPIKSPLHQSHHHESGLLHVSGEAVYTDDVPPPPGTLIAHIFASPHAHGRITRLDVSKALEVEGVRAVLTSADIPGKNDISPFASDEPLLAQGVVHAVGQAVALIVGDDIRCCRIAAKSIVFEVSPLPAILTIPQAIDEGSFLGSPSTICRGDVEGAFGDCALVLEGVLETGGQEHFYLEGQAALAIPEERQTYRVISSTQSPTSVQEKVVKVLGVKQRQVNVETRRMGGGFGGKETQASAFGAMVALAAWRTRRSVKIRPSRHEDMTLTGGRHPFYTRYKAGFDEFGMLIALRLHTWSNAGWCNDLSAPVLDRAIFHADNAYFIPHVEFVGRLARTNTISNTAYRGFGGPQGMVVVESIMDRAARRLGLDPVEIRRQNFYRDAPCNLTHYGQEVTHNRLERITDTLLTSADYAARRAEIDAFNVNSPWLKRGIGFQAIKFGIAFTNTPMNHAGALVLIYADGSVQLNHGGTEMGQGLFTKMMAVCAHELGVRIEDIAQMPTATDKVPNTSPTAASAGSDLNGQAVAAACRTLIARLRPVATHLLGLDAADAESVVFADGRVFVAGLEDAGVAFSAVTQAAFLSRVSLMASGFYSTPGLHYDAEKGRGKPFHYFAFGAALTEVEVNSLTGEHRLRRVDILHDVGNSLIPSIDIGQIEGGFIQGYGWLTCEELLRDASTGRLLTSGPDTYKIPSYGQTPLDLRVSLLDSANQPGVIHGSKAVGEPPFMLAIGTVGALRHAISAFAADSRDVVLSIPCTGEAVLRAIGQAREPVQEVPS